MTIATLINTAMLLASTLASHLVKVQSVFCALEPSCQLGHLALEQVALSTGLLTLGLLVVQICLQRGVVALKRGAVTLTVVNHLLHALDLRIYTSKRILKQI